MRSVALRGHYGGSVVVEVVAARSVVVSGNHITFKVLVVHVDAFVHNGDNDITAADCEVLPDGHYIDIGILVTGIVKMPLTVEIRVVEGA